jgi:hypothetical protein
MNVHMLVILCVAVLVGWCIGGTIGLCAYKHFGGLRRWVAERDDRALLNRQRKAARDREMRKVESTADRAAQMHEIFADVIHPTTPYCDYLDTPRDAMPRVRRSKP